MLHSPVALIDSGLGGLTVLSALRDRMPQLDVVYFADTAHVPYGDRSLGEVAWYGRQMIDWLSAFQPAAIIVASGTTCAAFEAANWSATGVPQLGVAALGAAAGVAASKTQNIGVIATQATTDSGIFERKIHALEPAAIVTSVAAPALVPLVESGAWAGDGARDAVAAYVSPVRAANCDTLILGCTHFPHLRRWFVETLGEGVRIVDPADATAAEAERQLRGLAAGNGRLLFAVSGDVADFARHALQLSGFVANDTQQVAVSAPGQPQSPMSA